ncbi:hypothetical protein DCO58_12365 [Helicobacter saguini]|uniref:Uncharacterized protein n=1 Tax=Helicobacter saguini TaxID=1548018 RepID=A0A347VQK0_9HELI|nr:hypothetical protein [Helicobacter saguini]MWV60916.1 hypothetical protein [Helicobacter saguini]MWV68416.1 hypothetical protein [Helicobacter saguini]MWV70120.1 hypothetical protein [Helicobacter saguini]MWV72023.1 hypothetical protein [Helicobacter saguini]TLD93753.1 hypothetical protein LS64_008140 [Helicobacter saguini]
MKKLISSVLLASVLSVSGLSAKANVDSIESKISTSKIQQADANFLFDNVETSKVAVLNEQELGETKGEFWGLAFLVIAGIGGIINAGLNW